jgi:hypothetical protein
MSIIMAVGALYTVCLLIMSEDTMIVIVLLVRRSVTAVCIRLV